ncbi:hypothetical protein KXD40_003708 [Peronospora effusa]|uniref:Protein preY, mitochondrial n=2 Tax=Peronospora TaxID=70742 RepID=A0A3M6V8S0_9STRA|nr:hypothetical protein DD238_007011 [Peronospora effusa]CAH0484974.1 unnamed protein product [Peronospora farinosa]RQM13192.1 hypothetical protein DD237_005612 [Peronospora effusa]UIZ22991.1 hypothetical protein KXD40_003708 [Peronospora effusa]CAI5703374.1 unnamed protein product [Peronospora effusa]
MNPLRTLLRPAVRRVASTRVAAHNMSSSSLRFNQKTAKLLDESVMEHLVCPISKYPLHYDTERGSLVCEEIHVEYPIWQGIPLLVPSEGRIINSCSSGDDS